MITNMLLAQMKAAVTPFLTDTCTIYARSQGKGELGQPLEVFTVVASGVVCRVIDDKASQAMPPDGLSRETMVDRYRLVVPAGTALDSDQRIKTDSDGLTYDVVGLVTQRTSEIDRQAYLVRVR